MIDPAVKDRVCDEVAAVFGVTRQAIAGRGRTATVALARQAAMVLLLDRGYSTGEIGRLFFRDHGTVVHAARAVEAVRTQPQHPHRARLERLFADVAQLPEQGGVIAWPA